MRQLPSSPHSDLVVSTHFSKALEIAVMWVFFVPNQWEGFDCSASVGDCKFVCGGIN